MIATESSKKRTLLPFQCLTACNKLKTTERVSFNLTLETVTVLAKIWHWSVSLFWRKSDATWRRQISALTSSVNAAYLFKYLFVPNTIFLSVTGRHGFWSNLNTTDPSTRWNITYGRSINSLILFTMSKNCHSNAKSLSVHLFIKETKLTVAFIEAYQR